MSLGIRTFMLYSIKFKLEGTILNLVGQKGQCHSWKLSSNAERLSERVKNVFGNLYIYTSSKVDLEKLCTAEPGVVL